MRMKIEGVVERLKKNMRTKINEDSDDIDKAMYSYVVFCDLLKGHAFGKLSVYPELPALLKRNLNEDSIDDLLLHLAKIRVHHIIEKPQDVDIRENILTSIDALMSLVTLHHNSNFEYLKDVKSKFTFEDVLGFMQEHQGEVFQTVTGVDFTYEIIQSEGYDSVCFKKLDGTVVRRGIGIILFEAAWNNMPAKKPIQLCPSSSGRGYIFSVLTDIRLYPQGDQK